MVLIALLTVIAGLFVPSLAASSDEEASREPAQ
jgi:hypothetical protein